MAEERGIGFKTGNNNNQFHLKDPPREDFRYMCMPGALEKEMTGFITHVCI